MGEASLFLKKRPKPRPRNPTVPIKPLPPRPVRNVSTPSSTGSPAAPSPAAASSTPKSQNVTEIKLFSVGDTNGTRYNIMRMHSDHDVDPRQIPGPILLNRKPRHEAPKPLVAYDTEGRVLGKYVYDKDGKPVVDAEGQQVIEEATGPDSSLVGGAQEGRKKRKGKSIRDVYSTDVEMIKLKREENEPWILESGQLRGMSNGTNGVKSEAGPSGVKTEEGSNQAKRSDRWTASYQEPTSMGTVLIIDNQNGSFGVVPLGRTYRFIPDRPFETLDSDAANKEYEHQARHKMFDRWTHRPGGGSGPSTAPLDRMYMQQEIRAQRMDVRSRVFNGENIKPKIKVERFDDDFHREGRRLERGMEGGEDEELDYDVNEDFQDDEDNNNFHRNEEEEEEQKRIDERLKKEFKLANANVGDRPQIESGDESDDDLFGDKLNTEGKKLRKMMRKRGERDDDDIFGSDDDSDSDADTVKSEKSEKKREEASAPGSAERPSRPPSRGPGSGPRPQSPSRRSHLSAGKAQTAPPGSGAALFAQRATGNISSPRRHRTGSPSHRAQSPENGQGRGSSPVSARGASPSRENSPGPSSSRPNFAKHRSTPSHSPAPLETAPSPGGGPSSNKRKTSPSIGAASDARKKKKSSSLTPTPQPQDVEPFPGMITREEIVGWFKRYPEDTILMNAIIQQFKPRLAADSRNQPLFLGYVKQVTTKDVEKKLRILRDRL